MFSLVDVLNDSIGGSNNPHVHSRKHSADAGATSTGGLNGGVGEDFSSTDRCHRQAFRGAVGCMNVGIRTEHGCDATDHMQRYGSSCRKDSVQSLNANSELLAVASHAIPHGWRTVGLCGTLRPESVKNSGWINCSRASGIHFGNHRSNLHGQIEQSEQRKPGQVCFSGSDSVKIADQVHLSIEHTVFEDDTFRWPCAATGENNGRRIGGQGLRKCHGRCQTAALQQAVQ